MNDYFIAIYSLFAAVPAVCGAAKGEIKLASLGWICCLAVGLLVGPVPIVPVCAYFVYRIFEKGRSKNRTDPPEPENQQAS